MIVKIVVPLMKLFRIVDSDDKSILSYVYEGMYRARKTIKEIISNKKRLFRPYIRIVKDRWDNQLRKIYMSLRIGSILHFNIIKVTSLKNLRL